MDDTGRYLSPEGANCGSRALPYDPSTQQYAVYEVVRDLPVSSGRAAAWFDEVGGATQYMLDDSVADLINQGFIRQVSP
ncbi:TNT domain-containing protein [Rhodovulum sulfidophilum]|uniref:TNT domain-containing protein n=1 Tax=Rhodovulum sulfidophilum TaxID=35806 RepID=UPI00398C54F3